MSHPAIRSSVVFVERGLTALRGSLRIPVEEKFHILKRLLSEVYGPQTIIEVAGFTSGARSENQDFRDDHWLASMVEADKNLPKFNLAANATDLRSFHEAQQYNFPHISFPILSGDHLKRILEDGTFKQMATSAKQKHTHLRLEFPTAFFDSKTEERVSAKTTVDMMKMVFDPEVVTKLVIADPTGKATISQILETIELAKEAGITPSSLACNFSNRFGMGVVNTSAAVNLGGVEEAHVGFAGGLGFKPEDKRFRLDDKLLTSSEEMAIALGKTKTTADETVDNGIYMGGRVDVSNLVNIVDDLINLYDEKSAPTPSSKAMNAFLAKKKSETPQPNAKAETVTQVVAGVTQGQSHA